MKSDDELDELIEEAIVDAYGEQEQRVGFYTMLCDNLAFPFKAKIIGEEVTVSKLTMKDEQRILAVCQSKGRNYSVDIMDLEINTARVDASQWIAAYREWGNYV